MGWRAMRARLLGISFHRTSASTTLGLSPQRRASSVLLLSKFTVPVTGSTSDHSRFSNSDSHKPSRVSMPYNALQVMEIFVHPSCCLSSLESPRFPTARDLRRLIENSVGYLPASENQRRFLESTTRGFLPSMPRANRFIAPCLEAERVFARTVTIEDA
jgi:hypothetical protein